MAFNVRDALSEPVSRTRLGNANAQTESPTSLYAMHFALQPQGILDSTKDCICFIGQLKSIFNNFIYFFLMGLARLEPAT